MQTATITAFYQYDSQGQRVRKTIINGAHTSMRKYVGQWEVYTETLGGGTTLQRETLHQSDDHGRVALIDTPIVPPPGEVQLLRYQYTNHLGTAALELDKVGNVISYEEYYPFGNTSFQSGRTAAEVSLKRYRYVGKERDNESGFYYMGARYYCSWLCRWMAADPINNEYYNLSHGQPGRNLKRQFVELTASGYEYCGSGPNRFIDPTGEAFKTKKHDSATAINTATATAVGTTIPGTSIPIPEELTKNLPDGGRLPSPAEGRSILEDIPKTAEAEEGGGLLSLVGRSVGLTLFLVLMPNKAGGDIMLHPYKPSTLERQLHPRTEGPFKNPNQVTQPKPEFPKNYFKPSGDPDHDEDESQIVYRSMKMDSFGSPVIEESARGLGVRTPDDIYVDSNGMVYPGMGGCQLRHIHQKTYLYIESLNIWVVLVKIQFFK